MLLLCSLFFLLITAMSRQALSMLSANQSAARAAEARALAWAGLADARAKLARDLRFPPRSEDQRIFTYSEEVTDVDSTEVVGSYHVTVDSTWLDEPYQVIRLRSEGVVGETTRSPARHVVLADLDLSNPASNPQLFQLLRFQDLGVP